MEVSAPAAMPSVQSIAQDNQAQFDGAQGESQESDLWEPQEQDWNKKIKHKVNGKEVTLTLKQLRDGYGLEQTARERMEEAAQHRKWREQHEPEIRTHRESQKKIQDMFDSVRGDFDAYLELGRSLGHDVDNTMFQRVMEEVKYRTADETERAAIDRERNYAKQQKELEKLKKQTQTYEQQQYTQQYRQALGKQHSEVLAKHPDFESDTLWRDETLQVMLQSRQPGRQSLSMLEAAEQVRQKFDRVSERRAEALLRQRIESGNIPEELRQSVRTRETEAIKDRKQANFGGQRASTNSGATSKNMSIEEYFDSLKQKR